MQNLKNYLAHTMWLFSRADNLSNDVVNIKITESNYNTFSFGIFLSERFQTKLKVRPIG